MASGKLLYKYVEVTDDIPVQKLSVGEHLRLLLRQLTYDPANELNAEDSVTREYLTLKANLLDLINKALKPVRNGDKKNVVLSVSSKFRPVLKEVVNSKELTDFYHVSVAYPKVEYDIALDVLVKLEVKET